MLRPSLLEPPRVIVEEIDSCKAALMVCTMCVITQGLFMSGCGRVGIWNMSKKKSHAYREILARWHLVLDAAHTGALICR